MAVWHYCLFLVPAESAEPLLATRPEEIAAAYGTGDGMETSGFWQARPQPAAAIVEKAALILKRAADAGTWPLFGSPKRWQLQIRSDDPGNVRDLLCKIDVHAMQDMRVIMSEIVSLAGAFRLSGLNDESGVIVLSDAAQLLRSVSQSRAVRYVRDPDRFVSHISETYHLPAVIVPPKEGEASGADAKPAETGNEGA